MLKNTVIQPEKLKKMQHRGLEMLLYFKEICDKNGLLFYFCGGCCIGAVRNKGFIPWDDDVDVFMPRPDYEKLIQIWDSQADTSRYSLQVTTKDRLTQNMFATICDNNTTFIKSYQANLDINHGLALDILPLDGCPSGRLARKKQLFWALIYSLYIIGQPPRNHGRLVCAAGQVLLAIAPSKGLRYKLWKMAERKMTKYPIDKCSYITELCSGPRYMKLEYPAEIFSSAVMAEFEGYMLPIPKGYDAYLRMAFGDYMQIPPKEQQVCHHEFEMIDMDHSYKIYKGKYYCTEESKNAD